MGWRTARHGRWLVLAGLMGCSGSKDTDTTSCFPAGTRVSTPSGPVAIEALRAGDAVLSWSAEGALVTRRVTDRRSREVGGIWRIDLGDRKIEVTDEHPFWSLTEERWVPVRELVPGDALAEIHGDRLVPITVRAMVRERRSVTVHNLSVQGPEHDYFTAGVLVHNKTWAGVYSDQSWTSSPTTSVPSFQIEVAWIDDGLEPTDTDGDGQADSQCGDLVDIDIHDPLEVTAWDFGIAEVDGWTGEDCFNGAGTAFQVCHRIGLVHTLDQVNSCAPEDVVAGESTVFDASREPELTYYFEDTVSGGCFVFGADPAYYEALGCTVMA